MWGIVNAEAHRHWMRRLELIRLLNAQLTFAEIIEHFNDGAPGKTRKMVKWHLRQLGRA